MKHIKLILLSFLITGCAYTPKVIVNNEVNDYILMNKIYLPKGYAVQSFHPISEETGIYYYDVYKGKCSDNVLAFNHYFGSKKDGYISSFDRNTVGFCLETDEEGKSFVFISEETYERESYKHIVETIGDVIVKANNAISENKYLTE